MREVFTVGKAFMGGLNKTDQIGWPTQGCAHSFMVGIELCKFLLFLLRLVKFCGNCYMQWIYVFGVFGVYSLNVDALAQGLFVCRIFEASSPLSTCSLSCLVSLSGLPAFMLEVG